MYPLTTDQILHMLERMQWSKSQGLHDDFPIYKGESELYSAELVKSTQFGPAHYMLDVLDRVERRPVRHINGAIARSAYESIEAKLRAQGPSL